MNTTKALEQFNNDGYVVLGQVLSPDEISQANAGIDRHIAEHPDDLSHLKKGDSLICSPLKFSDSFDFLVEHPVTLELLGGILGENLALEEIGIIIREAKALEEFKGWHRDLIRDFDRRFEIPYISCVFYLSDVGEEDHCLAVIPGTHDRLVDLNPKDCEQDAGVDINGPAGTVVLFHGRCIHSARMKAASRQRRSVHIYYGLAGEPRTTEWTYYPERLREKNDPNLPPKFYDKWQETRVIDGVGKIPEGIDHSLTIPEIIKEIQVRAKQKMN